MFNFALVTTLEVVAVLLIIIGFMFEEKVIDFEDKFLSKLRDLLKNKK